MGQLGHHADTRLPFRKVLEPARNLLFTRKQSLDTFRANQLVGAGSFNVVTSTGVPALGLIKPPRVFCHQKCTATLDKTKALPCLYALCVDAVTLSVPTGGVVAVDTDSGSAAQRARTVGFHFSVVTFVKARSTGDCSGTCNAVICAALRMALFTLRSKHRESACE